MRLRVEVVGAANAPPALPSDALAHQLPWLAQLQQHACGVQVLTVTVTTLPLPPPLPLLCPSLTVTSAPLPLLCPSLTSDPFCLLPLLYALLCALLCARNRC